MAERKGTVLVVDDEEPVRCTAAEILDYLGYAVITAGSGEEAAAILRHGSRPEFVLLDVVMPGWSGAQTVLALREIDPEVAILISTGHGDRSVDESLVREGVVGFVPKPYGIETLARHMEAAQRASRRRR